MSATSVSMKPTALLVFVCLNDDSLALVLETSTQIPPTSTLPPYPTVPYKGPYTGEYMGNIWQPRGTPPTTADATRPYTVTTTTALSDASNESSYAPSNKTHNKLIIYNTSDPELIKKLAIATGVCTPWCDRLCRSAGLILDIYRYEDMVHIQKTSLARSLRARENKRREEILRSPEREKRLELRKRYGVRGTPEDDRDLWLL
ncbi:unnamed protein product [Toxocara canis]|uniref:Similar to n=1 Tax=Toxocara canis TaxID=6265 RepID=A0A183USG2_TOXCA|nr:unnamed protein product [Toxocara canis]